jgi:hypothetical protein
MKILRVLLTTFIELPVAAARRFGVLRAREERTGGDNI